MPSSSLLSFFLSLSTSLYSAVGSLRSDDELSSQNLSLYRHAYAEAWLRRTERTTLIQSRSASLETKEIKFLLAQRKKRKQRPSLFRRTEKRSLERTNRREEESDSLPLQMRILSGVAIGPMCFRTTARSSPRTSGLLSHLPCCIYTQINNRASHFFVLPSCFPSESPFSSPHGLLI